MSYASPDTSLVGTSPINPQEATEGSRTRGRDRDANYYDSPGDTGDETPAYSTSMRNTVIGATASEPQTTRPMSSIYRSVPVPQLSFTPGFTSATPPEKDSVLMTPHISADNSLIRPGFVAKKHDNPTATPPASQEPLTEPPSPPSPMLSDIDIPTRQDVTAPDSGHPGPPVRSRSEPEENISCLSKVVAYIVRRSRCLARPSVKEGYQRIEWTCVGFTISYLFARIRAS